ncbi:hypothetical protein GR212_15420 [Rhizobium lusitanum]|uniref:Uncharacterized protein n=1 Tax=Rhizobium lusitanum TaxID=293958 RepID=A0A6L9U4X6_9HYPH|nr:hypothetical protein [Rhizobium lusitanum]NEI70973.1 hypothetical protein [Rhizobium lusitanum]
MTTTVIVQANHGWPVDVTVIDTATNEARTTARVPKDHEVPFYVHSGQDLLIHEVQPYELAAEADAE